MCRDSRTNGYAASFAYSRRMSDRGEQAHVPEASVRIVAPQETDTDLTAKPVLGTKERADGDLKVKSFSHIDLNV